MAEAGRMIGLGNCRQRQASLPRATGGMDMSDKKADGDVSPMEAQNEGPAHKGPREEKLIETGKSDSEKRAEDKSAAIRKGGEDESRDDL